MFSKREGSPIRGNHFHTKNVPDKKFSCSSRKISFAFIIFQIRHDDRLFSKVEYILLDPSCSGSGIVSRMDKYVDDDNSEEVD